MRAYIYYIAVEWFPWGNGHAQVAYCSNKRRPIGHNWSYNCRWPFANIMLLTFIRLLFSVCKCVTDDNNIFWGLWNTGLANRDRVDSGTTGYMLYIIIIYYVDLDYCYPIWLLMVLQTNHGSKYIIIIETRSGKPLNYFNQSENLIKRYLCIITILIVNAQRYYYY